MSDPARSPNVVWHASGVAREERWSAAGVRGATVWPSVAESHHEYVCVQPLVPDFATHMPALH